MFFPSLLINKLVSCLALQLFKPGPASSSHTGKVKAPKGLYLYGSVGCGKTMLMDMFYENCTIDKAFKKRVHFHSFMLDVHHSKKLDHI